MLLTIKSFIACSLLTLLVAASAAQSPFPQGKTLVYKYRLDAKAGAIEPASYASQFALEGTLYVKHHTSDPKLKNAFYVVLANVKTGMYNGIAAYNHLAEVNIPIPEAAATFIHQPFLIIYDENGRFEGVKILENEAEHQVWSRNMKMALASMLQLDIRNMNLETPIEDHSFISDEKTIHGDCSIIYDVRTTNHSTTDEFIVTKFLSPKNCTDFTVTSFNHVDIEGCRADKEEPMTVDSRRIFDMERKNGDIVIKKLVAIGGINYLPWNSEAEFHYVLTNATFELESVLAGVSGIDVPVVSFENLPIIQNTTYRRANRKWADNAAEDITQGRHDVNPEINACKLMKILGEAADYIEENHLEMNAPEWKHGQTLNRILHTMSYLDIGSIQHVFNAYKSAKNPRDITIRNLLIGVMPQVGTAATTLFTLNIIRNRKVSDGTAIEILAKLPLGVKIPDENLLIRMEDLLKFNQSISLEVKKASILCFSSLVYRTFKDSKHPEKSPILNRYLGEFLQHVKNESSTYEMKMLYIMAIKNVRVGKIYDLLGPIIRGSIAISENPIEIRVLSIWAIEKAVEKDYRIAHNLLWPVMANESLPVKLRIAAYEILMHQARNQADVFQMRRFMTSESNRHLYHYHYTTMNNIVKSVDPCKLHLRELITKIMRNSKPRENIKHILSSVYSFDYKIEKYNYLEKLVASIVVNEVTGVPELAQLDNIITDGREPISDVTVRLDVQGCDEIINLLVEGKYLTPSRLMNPKVVEILKKASKDYPKKIRIDVVLLHMGRIILANHYNQRTLMKLYKDVGQFVDRHINEFRINSQHVIYIHLSEKQVMSDIGVPVIVKSRLPVAASLKIKYNKVPEYEPTSMDLGMDIKLWSQGDYAMSIYNPMSDVWHTIRRPTAIDVSLPIRAIINWKGSLMHDQQVSLSFRRLSASKAPIAGIRMHVKDMVTVDDDDDETDAFDRSCPTCKHQEDITLGKLDVITRNIDSTSTGLEYSMNIFDCERGAARVTLSSEWYKGVMSERNSTWTDWYVNDKVTTRQELNNMLPGSMGSLGILLKIEPSTVYPTSRLDTRLRANFQNDRDTAGTSFNLLGGKKFNFYGIVDAISASTNTSARSWAVDVKININQDHTLNIATLEVIRKTPGEKNLKICLQANKNYSQAPILDVLRMNAGEESRNEMVVTSNVTIAAAYTDGEECAYNGALVTMTIKAELSDEQRKKLTQDLESGSCSRDIGNSLYANPENTVPMTSNCLLEALRYTTLRKYTVNVAHQKVPEGIADMIFTVQYIIRDHKLPTVKYIKERVDEDKIKMRVKLPMRKNMADVTVVLPMGSYDAPDIPIDIPILKSLGPTIKSPWYWPLENSRFSLEDLVKYTWDATRFCSIYRQAVITADGASVSFNISDRWTLISGDHVDQRFAIFAKSVGDNLAAKVYMENSQVEIVTDSTNGFQVTVGAGKTLGQLDDAGVLLVPANIDSWILKLTKKKMKVFVQMKNVPLTIVHNVNNIVVAIDTKLQGRVCGICGHMDGTYLASIPETYESAEL